VPDAGRQIDPDDIFLGSEAVNLVSAAMTLDSLMISGLVPTMVATFIQLLETSFSD
jgi:hypothetical protein